MFQSVLMFDEKIEDFPVEGEINQAKTFPALEKYCTCGELIGMYQRVIESMIGKRLNGINIDDRNEALSQIRIDVFSELGIRRDCCLKRLTVYPFHCFNDIQGIDAYVDTTYADSIPTQDIGIAKSRPKVRNQYVKTTKVFEKGKKASSNSGTKNFVGYYPVDSKIEPDFYSFEQKLFAISRGEKNLNGEVPPAVIFPLREKINPQTNIIPTIIPPLEREK